MNIADEIMSLEPNMRSGSLCIFGCWFGRPMDNHHQTESAAIDGEVLKLVFDEGKTLEIWNPSELTIHRTTLKIYYASKVKWSWYYYGKPKQPDNIFYNEYIVNDNNVLLSTNSSTTNKPNINAAAAELHFA